MTGGVPMPSQPDRARTPDARAVPEPRSDGPNTRTGAGLGPIFVAGADRSGTTLMSALVGSHSAIALPPLGSNTWTFFHGQFGDLANDENLDRCLAALARYKNVRRLQPDVARLRRDFRQGARSYARLFMLIGDQYGERAGKPRWGDKTSYVERYADVIFAERPGSRFIHMVRDPRDRFASAIRRWPDGRGQLGGATARWLYSVRLAQRNARRYPDRYLVVRFESFVADAEGTLRRVCAFLDEPYEPAMFALADAESFRAKGGNSSFDSHEAGGISTRPVGRYRSVLRPDEVAFIQACVARQMRNLSYEPDAVALPPAARVSFAVRTLPINVSRLVGWWVLETLQHRLPGRFGRSPDPGRVVRGSPD